MIFDVSIAMTWLLFLALFPITFYWTRNAWRILYQRDYSHVALKRGEPPSNPEKFAPYAAAINLTGAAIVVYVIFGVVSATMAYSTWSAVAGSTIWMKIIFDFILSRHAHMAYGKRK
jgi:hypothetical protein